MAKILRAIANSQIFANPANQTFYPVAHLGVFRRSKPKEEDFVLVRAEQQDTSAILNLMWDSYYPDEPTVNALGLGRYKNLIFDDLAMSKLCNGTSIVARCRYNGCIVGAAINETICPWDPEMLEKFACTLKCKGIGQLLMFYAHVMRAPKLWKKYCTNNIFHIANVFVKRDDRMKGVATKLVCASRDLGSDMGFGVIRVDARNHYLELACKQMNLKEVYALRYCDYIDDKNEVIFKIPEPHTSVKVFIDTPHAPK